MPINNVSYLQLSQDFLYAARTGDSTKNYIDKLGKADLNDLFSQLNGDEKKVAFWLNIYNAYTQILLKNNPEKYKSRSSFFSDKKIVIGGRPLSLDIIEHGLLRRSKIKWSMGYLSNPFPSDFEKRFRVSNLDYRIHFALNCGAKSCPPIAFYEVEQLNEQLDLATRTYLEGEAKFDSEKNTIKLPAIMGWFRGDFGGKKQMLQLLKKIEIIPKNSSPKIEFLKYDWTLYLNNYKS
ncbi:MAG: DUF547 domain-containing protein [Pyrinomonadaceae bacterium]|nr:DUF547 domain-containing protein [Sphingobacteriaceae bacterium]